MNNEIKAILLVNNPIAIPAMREFLFYGKVGAVVVTRRNKEMQQIVGGMLGESSIPLIIVSKHDYEDKIRQAIQDHDINIGIMMTFPFIISTAILELPQKGFINFHFGLLPQCRGPHPILWHLLRNDTEAGVSVHKVDSGIDTGEIIIQEKIAIGDGDTYGALQAKLAYLAAKPAVNLLKILSFGSIIPSKPQDESKANYYEMPGAKDLTIDWGNMSGEEIIRMINACNPWNKGAGTKINDWIVGITEAESAAYTDIDAFDDSLPSGTILACDKVKGLIVKTNGNQNLKINIIYLQEGFYSGHRLGDFGIQPGMQFS